MKIARSSLALGLAVVVCAVGLHIGPAWAAEPSYLAKMPSPQEVLQKTRGSDQFDTWTRQVATLERLLSVMDVMEGDREFNPDKSEQKLRAAYNRARFQVETQLAKSLPAGTDPLPSNRKLFDGAFKYEANHAFKTHLMRTFFSADFQKNYAKGLARNAAIKGQGPITSQPDPSQGGDSSRVPRVLWIWLGVFFFLFVISRVHLLRSGRVFWH